MIELANWTKIGKRVETRRKQLGFSKKTMSEYLDVSIPTYTRMEKGKRKFSIWEMQGICLLFHISPDYFLTGEMGLLECRDLFRNLQEIPECDRNLLLGLSWHIYHREQKKKKSQPEEPKNPTV